MNITQEDINKYIENGGSLSILTDEQKAKTPQKFINKRIENDGYLCDLTKNQIIDIPQESINKYAENGGDLRYLTDEQRKNIPQKSINKYAENGGDMWDLTDEQKANIPQESIKKRFENEEYQSDLTDKQIDNIPESLIPKSVVEISDKAKESLILYGVGKIDSDELPDDIYVNCQARQILLSIAKHKLINAFNAICEEYGYADNVPQEVVKAFDSKLVEMEEWIEKKREEGLENLLATKNPAIDKIKGLEW